jgi:hypothetical protein
MADAEDLKSGQATWQRPAPERITAKIISVYRPSCISPVQRSAGQRTELQSQPTPLPTPVFAE